MKNNSYPSSSSSKTGFNRWILLTSCIVMALFVTSEKSYGQAASTYIYATSTGNSLQTITSPTVVTTTVNGGVDDDYSLVTPAGFSFNGYNGVSYTQYSVSTNGWLAFGNNSATTIPSSLTSVSIPCVYAFGRDANLNTGNGGNLTHGPAAGGLYVFQFTNESGGGSGAASATVFVTMQIVLWGTTSSSPGRIDVIYGSSTGTPASAGTIGIRDAAGFVNGVNGSTSSTTTTMITTCRRRLTRTTCRC